MVFLFTLLITILMFLTIRIKIEFINLRFRTNSKEHINNDYKIKIIIYTFQKLPILKTTIDSSKMNKIINNERVNKLIKDQNGKIIITKKDYDKEIIDILKKLKIELNEMNFKIFVGTKNAAITAFIIPVISTFLALFLSKKVTKYNDKQIFSVTPVYTNENLINIEFSGIFQIKIIHIINTVCIVNKKKRKGDKYERTSNRRAYGYSYE